MADDEQPRQARATRLPRRISYLELTARQRVERLLDPDSFNEILKPTERLTSPHLAQLDQPVAFDDGVVIGSGRLEGHRVLIAAQEGRFMGGAVGEIHGAKLTGLLERAVDERPVGVLLLLDTGGVRLHEANAGLIAMGEIQRAVLDVRHAGLPVIAIVGGSNGCYGGLAIIACSCSAIIMSEEGRLSISGPEVIETVAGVEAFDSRDRALVWATMGGKHRALMGDASYLVADDVHAFRHAICDALALTPAAVDLATLERQHGALGKRLAEHGNAKRATEIWAALGVANPDQVSSLSPDEFAALLATLREADA
jgi:malonate decarboxylase beta subunit